MRICRSRVSGVFAEAEQVEEAATLATALGGSFVVALGAPVLTATYVRKASLLSPFSHSNHIYLLVWCTHGWDKNS